MAIKYRYLNSVAYGTLAEFKALKKVPKAGRVFQTTDTNEVRYADGVNMFDDLLSLPVAKAAVIPAIGAPTTFTAIGASFADLAAARTAVNTLRTETLTADTATNAKLDAVIAALKAAGLMATS